MTISSTTSQVLLPANGVATQFAFPNKIFQASDLTVTIIDLSSNQYPFTLSGVNTYTNSTLGISYTVFNIDVDTGCFITFTAPPTNLWSVDMRTVIAETQSTSIKNQGSFNPELHEEFFDKITREIQDLRRLAYAYGVHGPDIESVPWSALPSAAARANTLLGFTSAGLPTIAPSLATVLTQAAFNTFLTASTPYVTTPAEIAAGITPSSFQYLELDPRRYGFLGNGIANDYASINSAIQVAQKYNSARITLPQASANVVCNSTLVWDFNKVSIDLNGNTLDFSAATLTGSIAIAPTNSNANQNLRVLYNHAHPLQNGVLKNANSGNGNTCIFLNDGVITAFAGCKFRNLSFLDWGTDVALGSGASFTGFDQCTFTQTTGVSTTYSIVQQNATNTGERTTFIDCTWFNRALLINNQSTNGDLYFNGCSFDGFVRAFNGGNIYLNNCHIEVDSGGDSDYWGVNSGPFPLVINNTNITFTVSKTLDMFYSTSASQNGGVFMNNITLNPGGSWSGVLIGGPGNARATNIILSQFGAKPPLALSLNQLAYPDFNNASYTDDWAFSGTAPPARTAAFSATLGAAWSSVTAYVPGNIVSLGGIYYQCIAANTNNTPPNINFWSILRTVSTFSLQFAGAVASTGFAKATRPCQPGQFVVGRYYLFAPALTGSGGIFNAVVNFLDAAGGIISQIVTNTVSTNVAAFTLTSDGHQSPAPPGTVQCQMQFQLTGVTSGTPSVYLGYIDFTVN
jgi:hypothetical protein